MHASGQPRAWLVVGARCTADVVAGVLQVAGLRAATTHGGCSGPALFTGFPETRQPPVKDVLAPSSSSPPSSPLRRGDHGSNGLEELPWVRSCWVGGPGVEPPQSVLFTTS